MKNKKEYPDLTHDILSPMESWTAARNLEAIEAERERQKNPTRFDYLLWFLGGIAAFPLIVCIAFDFLRSATSVLEFIIFLVGALFVLCLDCVAIWAGWALFRI